MSQLNPLDEETLCSGDTASSTNSQEKMNTDEMTTRTSTLRSTTRSTSTAVRKVTTLTHQVTVVDYNVVAAAASDATNAGPPSDGVR